MDFVSHFRPFQNVGGREVPMLAPLLSAAEAARPSHSQAGDVCEHPSVYSFASIWLFVWQKMNLTEIGHLEVLWNTFAGIIYKCSFCLNHVLDDSMRLYSFIYAYNYNVDQCGYCMPHSWLWCIVFYGHCILLQILIWLTLLIGHCAFAFKRAMKARINRWLQQTVTIWSQRMVPSTALGTKL